MKLQSKRALVTGGGQGLGRAIVQELLSQGCDVAIHYHKSGEGAEEARQTARPGVRAHCFAADLTDEKAAEAMVKSAVTISGAWISWSITRATWLAAAKSRVWIWIFGRGSSTSI